MGTATVAAKVFEAAKQLLRVEGDGLTDPNLLEAFAARATPRSRRITKSNRTNRHILPRTES